MNSPAISIVIACFNARATLGMALDSLLAQSYTDFEIIVVDGASQDGTVALLQTYGERIARWISEPDVGIYDAWNKGLGLARGRWIGFLGADDVYLPNALQEYACYLADHPDLEYVSARVELFDGEGSTRIIGQAWQWVSFRRYMCVAHVGSLHGRSLFETYGHFNPNYRVCGDYELLLRAGARLRAGYVDSVFTRMHAGGISGSNRRALDETCHAKLQTHAATPVLAHWDYWVAAAKWYARRALGRL